MKRRRISKISQLHERALQLAAALKSAREKGTITPDHPMTGRVLAEKLNQYFHWDPPLSGDAGVRELVNHARSLKLPIAGDGRGYYHGKDSAEMGLVEQDMKSRIAKMSEALRGVQDCRREMVQIESEELKMFTPRNGDSLPDALTKHFDPEEVK